MPEAFASLERGATLLTAGTRLARLLRRQYSDFQQDQGRPVWETPNILPLEAWLKRSWRERIANGPERRILLNAAQEACVWESIIRAHNGDDLLRIPETAQAAAQAWRLAQQYRLPLDSRFEASEDCQAFLRWARDFRNRCEVSGWLPEAQLPDQRWQPPSRVFLAGFDSFTPQQEALLDTLGECIQIDFPHHRSQTVFQTYQDAHAEIRSAATAARRWLNQDPKTQIGIVVPDLAGMRAELERVFRESMGSDSPIHVSLGPALDEHPVIAAAFLLLEFAYQPLQLSRAGLLLRSPFLQGGVNEASTRASLDASLRRRGLWHLALDQLHSDSASCPRLQSSLRKVEKTIAAIGSLQKPSSWSRSFWSILEAFGWPGDRVLNSREHQTVEAFRALLSSFATLDLILDSVGYESALLRLRRLARDVSFQVENEGAPVQIMGELEAVGLEFDHLWVLGLHDEAWPRPPRPNPFLPVALQRQLRIPRSSAAVELTYSQNVIQRLSVSSPEVIFSHPKMDGERALKPTSLIEDRRWKAPAGELLPFTPVASLEYVLDEMGPALQQTGAQVGGTRLFSDMAACPFRAFAIHRLGAREMEESEFGLAPREKGTVVHSALELLWGELGSQEHLLALSEQQQADVVARNVDAALTSRCIAAGRKVEQMRLERLLGEWLVMERRRSPFRVVAREQKRDVTVGPLTVSIRADRIDEIEDGRLAILDYKTGEVKKDAWIGHRMKEPQVPLYCITSETEVAAAALVQLRAKKIKLVGLAPPAVLPKFEKMDSACGDKLDDQLTNWKTALEDLAHRFQAGVATVDPKEKACEFCPLTSLCRIEEIKDAG